VVSSVAQQPWPFSVARVQRMQAGALVDTGQECRPLAAAYAAGGAANFTSLVAKLGQQIYSCSIDVSEYSGCTLSDYSGCTSHCCCGCGLSGVYLCAVLVACC